MRANRRRTSSLRVASAVLAALFVGSTTVLGAGAAHANQGDTVVIPDPVLRSCIQQRLSLEPGAEIPATRMADLDSLTCRAPGISDLSGLETAKLLGDLYVRGDGTTKLDLTPLKDSVMLQSLTIFGSQVDDLSPLSALPGIKSLDLELNQVRDLSPISQLYSLERINLGSNELVDLTDLAGLHRLVDLSVTNNQLTDLAPVSALDNLESLAVEYNQINDLSPLAALPKLKRLAVASNPLHSLDALHGLDNLESFEGSFTGVSDIGALGALSNLTSVGLQGNGIEDIASLAGLPNLMIVNLDGNRIADVSALANFSGIWLAVRSQIVQGEAQAGKPAPNPIIGIDGLAVGSDAFWYDEVSNSFEFDLHGKAVTYWSHTSPDGVANYSGTIEWDVVGTQVVPETPTITQATTNKDGTVNDPVLTTVETVGVTYIVFGSITAGETARLYAFPHGGYFIDEAALPEGWAVDPSFGAVYFELVFDEAAPYTEPITPVTPAVPSGSTSLPATGAPQRQMASMLAFALILAGAGVVGLRERQKRSDG